MDPVMMGQGLTLSATIRAQAQRDAARLRRQGRLAVVSPTEARTRFTPSLARRRAQAKRFVQAVKGTNPALAESLAPAFQGDPVRFAAPSLARFGMKANDVADLAAIYLTGAWYGAHGKTSDPTRAEVVAVRDQLRRVFRASPKLARASDAMKQDIGEGSLYLAFVNDALISTMKAHPESKGRLIAEIVAGVKSTFGVDVSRMKLTRAGLEG
jgi:hypothetical protein